MHKKQIISFTLSVLVIFSVYFISANSGQIASAQATGDEVKGYAWSSNIGWLSFNGANYGVNYTPDTVDPNVLGTFSGYAWSSNIGWVDFNPTSGYPPAGPSHGAQLEVGNNLTGWIRACAGASGIGCSGVVNPESGGWDGWIKLSDPSWTNGVRAIGSPENGYSVGGFAWGGEDVVGTGVVGWLRFGTGTIPLPENCDPTKATGDVCIPPPGIPDVPECRDGIDNDRDGFTDFIGGDPGCENEDDETETDPDGPTCDDGIDNGGNDGADVDDSDCDGGPGGDEDDGVNECTDDIDNDGVNGIDWDGGPNGEPADPTCVDENDDDEGDDSETPGDITLDVGDTILGPGIIVVNDPGDGPHCSTPVEIFVTTGPGTVTLSLDKSIGSGYEELLSVEDKTSALDPFPHFGAGCPASMAGAIQSMDVPFGNKTTIRMFFPDRGYEDAGINEPSPYSSLKNYSLKIIGTWVNPLDATTVTGEADISLRYRDQRTREQ